MTAEDAAVLRGIHHALRAHGDRLWEIADQADTHAAADLLRTAGSTLHDIARTLPTTRQDTP